MVSWNVFVERRNLNVDSFISKNDLTTKEKFLAHLSNHGILAPSDEFMRSLFPNIDLNEEINQDEVEQSNVDVTFEKKKTASSRSRSKN